MNTVSNMISLLTDAINDNGVLLRGADARYAQVMEINHAELRLQNAAAAASIADVNLSNFSLVVRLQRTKQILAKLECA